MKTRVFVVFGAAVRPDGSASGTLRRRTLGAVALSKIAPARPPFDRGADSEAAASSSATTPPLRRFLVTGGQGRFGPPEAIVMRDLLRAEGVREEEIEIEPESRDTLESVLRCAEILARAYGMEGRPVASDSIEIVVATSPYHAPRCCLLLRLLGIPAIKGKLPADRSALGLRGWLYAWLREAIAIPWDAFLVLTVHRSARLGRSKALR